MFIERQTNAVMEGFCILLCIMILIYIFLDRKNKETTNKWYFGMVLSTLFINLGGMTDWLFSGVPGSMANALLWIGSTLFYCACASLILTYAGYERL